MGKRKRVTRKADGNLTRKLTGLVNLGGVLAQKADAFGSPFQLTQFSLPISGPLMSRYCSTFGMSPGEKRCSCRLNKDWVNQLTNCMVYNYT